MSDKKQDEARARTVHIVDWSAPCETSNAQIKSGRINCRKIFKTDEGAESFMVRLSVAAKLIGIESEMTITKVEMEVFS